MKDIFRSFKTAFKSVSISMNVLKLRSFVPQTQSVKITKDLMNAFVILVLPKLKTPKTPLSVKTSMNVSMVVQCVMSQQIA